MPSLKFITTIQGRQHEDTGLTASSGVADANKIIATNSNGKLDVSFLPDNIGANIVTVTATESLSAGDFVNIYNDGGTPAVRKANASTGLVANGYVLAAVSGGQSAQVFLEGSNSGRSGLTVGSEYFLGTAGGVQLGSNIPASPASGYIYQSLGVAVSATTISFEYNPPITVV